MAKFMVRLIDGTNLPLVDESNGDIIGIKDPRFLFVRSVAQKKKYSRALDQRGED